MRAYSSRLAEIGVVLGLALGELEVWRDVTSKTGARDPCLVPVEEVMGVIATLGILGMRMVMICERVCGLVVGGRSGKGEGDQNKQ